MVLTCFTYIWWLLLCKRLFVGVELSGKKEGPGLSMNPLLLTLEDDSDGYFKPGFPYKGRVGVTQIFCNEIDRLIPPCHVLIIKFRGRVYKK